MSSNKPCRTPLAAVREGCIPVPSTLGGFHEELPELFELRDTAINLASKRPGTGCLRWHISEAVEQHKLATTTATPYPAVPHRRPAHQPLVIRRGIVEIITHCVGVPSPCTVCHQRSIAPWRMCQVSDLPADWRHRTYMSSLDRPLLHSSYAGLYRWDCSIRKTTQVPQLQQPLVQVELCASSEAVDCHLTSEGATGQTATTDIQVLNHAGPGSGGFFGSSTFDPGPFDTLRFP